MIAPQYLDQIRWSAYFSCRTTNRFLWKHSHFLQGLQSFAVTLFERRPAVCLCGRITGCNCDKPPVALVSSSIPTADWGDLTRLSCCYFVVVFLRTWTELQQCCSRSDVHYLDSNTRPDLGALRYLPLLLLVSLTPCLFWGTCRGVCVDARQLFCKSGKVVIYLRHPTPDTLQRRLNARPDLCSLLTDIGWRQSAILWSFHEEPF